MAPNYHAQLSSTPNQAGYHMGKQPKYREDRECCGDCGAWAPMSHDTKKQRYENGKPILGECRRMPPNNTWTSTNYTQWCSAWIVRSPDREFVFDLNDWRPR